MELSIPKSFLIGCIHKALEGNFYYSKRTERTPKLRWVGVDPAVMNDFMFHE